LIVTLLFSFSGYAGDKNVNVLNTPLDVNVNNTPMVEVINTAPMPTVVNNTSSNPIPVTMNGDNGSQAIVSAFLVFSTSDPETIYTVPANKTFIITDMFSSSDGTFEIYKNAALKAKLELTQQDYSYPFNPSLHLRSGIPFISGSEVKVKAAQGWNFTIAGYLLND
jgi:hypothetical protein